MAYEVEIKFRVGDHAALAGVLAGRVEGAGDPVVQVDLYFRHPTRDFAATDEALRLRAEGPQSFLVYKGPKLGGPTKTREELEIPLAVGPQTRDDLARVLERLGFSPLREIRKTRVPFRLQYGGRAMVVALDRVDGLGTFAEVEAIAASQADLEDAQQAVLALAGELGLSEVEPRSYLRMAIEQAARNPDPGHVPGQALAGPERQPAPGPHPVD